MSDYVGITIPRKRKNTTSSTVFTPTTIDPQTGLAGALTFAGNCSACNGKTGFEPQHYLNFAPRIGLAYQATPKTVVRAAYGVFFADRAPNDYYGDPSCSVG
jgi:hypothetical protein